jgi:hypothetical protein
LPPVVKHAWDRGQPAPGIGAMTAPHAGKRAGERTVVLHCAKMRGAVAARHFIAGVGAAVKSPACSTSWHCCRACSAYIL